jgi:hypothetical protein
MNKNASTGHTVDFSTQTLTICIQQVLLVAYYKAVNVNTHLFFPSVFIFLFFDAFCFTFYAISLFLLIQSSDPNFAALHNHLVCLVVKPAVTKGKRPLRGPRHRCEDNIRMDLRDTEYGLDSSGSGRVQLLAFVNTVKGREFLD